MKIVINCRSCLNPTFTGIGRYTYHLIKSLSEIDAQNSYTIYAPKGPFDLRKKPPRFTARNFQTRIDYFKAGVAKVLPGTDVYHAPSPEVVASPFPKTVVTVHDLIAKTYPKGHTRETIEATDRQMATIVANAAKIICASESTFKDLKKYYPGAGEKASVIHEAVDRDLFYPLKRDEESRARAVLKALGVETPFILFVGTIEPRKNLANLLRAFMFLKEEKKFAGKLVVAGMKGWMSGWVTMLLDQLKIRDEVIFPGYLSNAELRYLYNTTAVYVFPSFYEGFGLPILEAFACGAPVITSDVSSCPEIAGDSALQVDPHDIRQMAAAMARVVADETLRADLRERGFKRVEGFSFKAMAEKTLEVYQEVNSAS